MCIANRKLNSRRTRRSKRRITLCANIVIVIYCLLYARWAAELRAVSCARFLCVPLRAQTHAMLISARGAAQTAGTLGGRRAQWQPISSRQPPQNPIDAIPSSRAAASPAAIRRRTLAELTSAEHTSTHCKCEARITIALSVRIICIYVIVSECVRVCVICISEDRLAANKI